MMTPTMRMPTHHTSANSGGVNVNSPLAPAALSQEKSIIFGFCESSSSSSGTTITTTAGSHELLPVGLIEFIQSVGQSLVVLGGILWMLAFCVSCVAWLFGRLILSCVYGSSRDEAKNGQTDGDKVDNSVPPSESAVVMRTSRRHKNRHNNKDAVAVTGGGGRKRRRRRKKIGNNANASSSDQYHSDDYRSTSGCGSCSSSCSLTGDGSDDPLPTDNVKCLDQPLLELERTERNLITLEYSEQVLSSTSSRIRTPSSRDLTVDDDDILDTSSKSLLDLWLCPRLGFKGSVVGNGRGNNGSNGLDLQTSFRLQQIVDLVALQAFLGLHRDAEHLRDRLNSLVCHEIEREKANMAVLNSIIEI